MPRERKRSRKETADSWFPTIVRFVGVGLIVYAALVDRGRNPGLIPTATGMYLLPLVWGKPPQGGK